MPPTARASTYEKFGSKTPALAAVGNLEVILGRSHSREVDALALKPAAKAIPSPNVGPHHAQVVRTPGNGIGHDPASILPGSIAGDHDSVFDQLQRHGVGLTRLVVPPCDKPKLPHT